MLYPYALLRFSRPDLRLLRFLGIADISPGGNIPLRLNLAFPLTRTIGLVKAAAALNATCAQSRDVKMAVGVGVRIV